MSKRVGIVFAVAFFWVFCLTFGVLNTVTSGVATASAEAEDEAPVVVSDRVDEPEVEEVAPEPEPEVVSEPEPVSGPEPESEPDPEPMTIQVDADEGVIEETQEDYGSSAGYDGSGYVNANVDGVWIAGSDFAWMGVHYDNGSGYSYTYYSQRVLPGGGLSIPGRHVGSEGYVVDGNGNLCLASDDLPYGTVVSVPFGSGTAVVYDCGSGYGNLDVYVDW